MRNRVIILCATLLSLTGCTGQAEPVAASSGAASSSVVESSSVPESSSEPEPSDEVESSSEPESASEPVSSDAAESSSEPEPSSVPESSSQTESKSEPEVSSAAEPSSAVPSAQATSNAAEPASMPPSSSEPVVSSAAEVPEKTEPLSSEPGKIPPGGPPDPPPPTQEELEKRPIDEKQAEWNRLAKRLAALGDTAQEVLPPDIFNDSTWRNVPPAEEGDYGTVDAIILYVTDEAVARELLEPYTDPEIPYIYQEVKYTRAEIDAIFEDVKSQEIIQKYEKQGKIYSLDAKYREMDQVVEVCTNEREPELERWLKTYKYAKFVLLSTSHSHKMNPA